MGMSDHIYPQTSIHSHTFFQINWWHLSISEAKLIPTRNNWAHIKTYIYTYMWITMKVILRVTQRIFPCPRRTNPSLRIFKESKRDQEQDSESSYIPKTIHILPNQLPENSKPSHLNKKKTEKSVPLSLENLRPAAGTTVVNWGKKKAQERRRKLNICIWESSSKQNAKKGDEGLISFHFLLRLHSWAAR